MNNDNQMKRVAFIGAGKVGFSLGKFLVEGGIHVTGYYSQHIESAKQAAEFTGSNTYENLENLINDSNVIFLTVPDGEIKSVFDTLRKYDINNKQICHCSGAMTGAEAFPEIEKYGALGYSIHPLFPVSSKLTSYREMSDAFFCLEGEGPGVREWEEILSKLCSGVKIIDGHSKVKYHAACAIASNLYCSLMQLSMELLGECGFTSEEAMGALAPLVRSNMQHILEDGPVKALTGPVERGDVSTVEKHIANLNEGNDKELYVAATRKLLEVARTKNPERDYTKFRI